MAQYISYYISSQSFMTGNIHSLPHPLVICKSWHNVLIAVWCLRNVFLLSSCSSFCLHALQALREPAIFAKANSGSSEPPAEKLTLAQARRGTPGTVVPL